MKAGDIVKVKVLEVDKPRKRIALTMRLTDAAPRGEARPDSKPAAKNTPRANQPRHGKEAAPAPNNAFADAFAKAKRR